MDAFAWFWLTVIVGIITTLIPQHYYKIFFLST